MFDATWLRPLIQHHIQERSGRRIDFDHLRIGLDAALQPTVRMRNLSIQNAPWAARQQPLIRAAELGFTLSWQSLRGERTVLTRLELVDAEIDLERRADGLRNWRLTHPDDRGPGRVRVQAIEARNTRAHVIDGGKRLELDLQVAALAAPIVLAGHADMPLLRQISARGTRDATPFEVDATVSLLPTIFDTGRPFALRGELRAGPARMQLEGTVTDLAQLAGAEVDLRLNGPRLAELGAVVGLADATRRLPALASDASAHVAKQGDEWTVSRLQARIGRSDFAGNVQITHKPAGQGRSALRAALRSERIDVAGWRTARPAAAAASSGPGAGVVRRDALDADVDLKVGTFEGAGPVALTGLVAHAALREGQIAMVVTQLAIAGGRASGTLNIDTASAPAAFALDLRLHGLQVAQLARSATHAAPGATLDGALNARLALRSRGESAHELGAAAAGTVTAELVRASIPDALDAKLALDGGHWLRSIVGAGSERVAVVCSALELQFERGRGEVRRLAFETPSANVHGSGSIDLGRASVDLVLTPNRKQRTLLALDRSMHVSGPLSGPKVALVAADRAAPAGGAACRPMALQ